MKKILCCLLMVASVNSLAVAQEASLKDFEDFKSAWQGRWEGQIHRHGEVVEAVANAEIRDNGNTVLVSVTTDAFTGTWVIQFDAASKRIRDTWSTSLGERSGGIVYRDGQDWKLTGEGSSGEGVPMVDQNRVTVTDGGDSHRWDFNVTSNDQTETYFSEWKRAPMPLKIRKTLNRYIGSWNVTGTRNGRPISGGRFTSTWNVSQTCVLMTSHNSIKPKMHGMGYWDAVDEKYIEHWVDGDGIHYEQRFELAGDGHLKGIARLTLPSGGAVEGEIESKFESDDRFVFSGRGGAEFAAYVNERIQSQAVGGQRH